MWEYLCVNAIWAAFGTYIAYRATHMVEHIFTTRKDTKVSMAALGAHDEDKELDKKMKQLPAQGETHGAAPYPQDKAAHHPAVPPPPPQLVQPPPLPQNQPFPKLALEDLGFFKEGDE